MSEWQTDIVFEPDELLTADVPDVEFRGALLSAGYLPPPPPSPDERGPGRPSR